MQPLTRFVGVGQKGTRNFHQMLCNARRQSMRAACFTWLIGSGFVAALSACAVAMAPERAAHLPSQDRAGEGREQTAARTRRLAARCSPSGPKTLSCRLAEQTLADVLLPFPVGSTAHRLAGGAYVLGPRGELARLDGRGRLSGVFQTEWVSLTTTRDYVCGADAVGQIFCARDHHQDRICSGADLAPLEPVALPPLPGAPLSSPDGLQLCVELPGGVSRCISAESSCERVCLAYPACGALRCLDPCAAERVAGA
jgi:hypothetical protein